MAYPGRLGSYQGRRAARIGKGLYRAKIARIGAGMAGQERKELSMTGISQGPWALQVAPGDSAGAVKVVSATGGVVALMKAAGGRKMQNGRAVVEVPALIDALKEARQWIAKGVADGAYNGCAAPLAPNRWLDRCGAILSRIDGAGDTLPDAPVPTPTDGER